MRGRSLSCILQPTFPDYGMIVDWLNELDSGDDPIPRVALASSQYL